ncbi:hypothetical protein [Nocardia camponoti]|uniref:Uncharacterized protein n=1 Tax=Nocardia camponoti TaxID=1616106 RepID=A0A917QK52_9NOCA|nr:hypothetical protein [Nocardia camponoti]GGK54238.1 hypothetical protein GCM10011591_27490 [Nocardia camponoti]
MNLVELLDRREYLLVLRAPSNAIRVIGALVDAGMLTEFTGYKRNRMWQARSVLTALDDFALRAGRRAIPS